MVGRVCRRLYAYHLLSRWTVAVIPRDLTSRNPPSPRAVAPRVAAVMRWRPGGSSSEEAAAGGGGGDGAGSGEEAAHASVLPLDTDLSRAISGTLWASSPRRRCCSGCSRPLSGVLWGILGVPRSYPLLKDCRLLLSSTTAMQIISSGERKSDTYHNA